MSINDKIKVAFQNLNAGKSMVKKAVIGITFVIMLICSFGMIIESYYVYMNNFDGKWVKDCYYYTEFREKEISRKGIEEILKNSNELQQKYQATEALVLCTIGKTAKDLEIGNCEWLIDDKCYNATNFNLYKREPYENIYNEKSIIQMLLYSNGISIFPRASTNAGKHNSIIGEYPNNPGEIMLDTYILNVYGIKDNYEEFIGSRISIANKEDNGKTILNHYIITGIFEPEMLQSRESKMAPDWHYEHMVVNLKQEDMYQFLITYASVRYYFDSYAEYIENYDKADEILKLNLTGFVNGDETSIRLTEKGLECCLLHWLMSNVGKLILLIGAVITMIITFSVFYIFQFYRNRNTHYFTMLQNIGMEKGDRRSIFVIEMSCIMLKSTIIGIYLSVMFVLLFGALTKSILNFEVIISIKTYAMSILASWVYFSVCLGGAMRKA